MSLATTQTISQADLRAYAFTREKIFADNIDHVFSNSPSVALSIVHSSHCPSSFHRSM